MGRELKILRTEPWFLGEDNKQEYPISYRYVISYALLFLLSEKQMNREDIRQLLVELQNSVKDKVTLKGKDFIDVLVLENDMGLVVVDQTDGIYPLVLDTQKRIDAFEVALKEVVDKFELICEYFDGHTRDSWTEKFQKALFEKAGFTH